MGQTTSKKALWLPIHRREEISFAPYCSPETRIVQVITLLNVRTAKTKEITIGDW